MNKRERFFLSGILVSAVGIAMRTVHLAFGAYIAVAVGAEGVGLNTLIMTVYAFAVTLSTSGISLTVTRLVAAKIGEGKPELQWRVLRAAFGYALFFGSLASLCLFLFAGVIGEGIVGDTRSVAALRILALSLLPTAISSVISGYFIGVRRVGANSAFSVFGQLLRIGLTVALIALSVKSGAEGAVIALAAGNTLSEIITAIFLLLALFVFRRKGSSSRYSGRGRELPSVLRMALPLAVSAYIRSLLLSLEHSLIPKRLYSRGETKKEALASYGALHGMALSLVLYPMAPLSSFAGLLVPELSESLAAGDRERLYRIVSAAMNRTLAFSVAVSAFLYLFSEELGYIIYSSYEAGHFIALLAPVIPIMYLDHVADSVLKGIGEQVYSMWVNIADATLSVLLVYFLIPIFGISGYAFVIIGMEGFNFLLSARRLYSRIRFRIDAARSLLIPLAASFLSSFISLRLFVCEGQSTKALVLVARCIFAICAYFAFYIPLSGLWGRLLKGRVQST